MALARTNVGAFQSGPSFGTGSFVTSSFTPAANSLLVVALGIEENLTTNFVANTTVAGGGLTFTKQQANESITNGGDGAEIWTAPVGGSPASMTLTLDNGANDIYRYVAHVYTYTGYDTGTPVNGKGGLQSAAGGANQTFTLDAAPTAADEAIAVALADGGGGQVITVGTGWTSQNASTPDILVTTQTRTGSISTTVLWNQLHDDGGSAGVVSSGIVVKAASGAAPDQPYQPHYQRAPLLAH